MRIDPFGLGDANDWLPLLNLTRTVPLSAADFAAREAQRPAGEILARCLGRIGGETVAIGQLAVAPYAPADHLALLVCTASAWRGAGCGTAMLAHLKAEAAAQGFAGLTATLPEAARDDLGWMLRRGFAPHALRFDSLLDLETLPPYGPENTLPPGLRLHDMSGATEADWRETIELFGRLLANAPDMRGVPLWSRERCEAVLRRSPGARDDWVVVARAGDRPVGLTVGHAMGDEIYSFFTGVVPELRGTGLGRALKRRLIAAAQADGIARMRTTNLDGNAPALRLNAALGFRRAPGSIEVRKRGGAERLVRSESDGPNPIGSFWPDAGSAVGRGHRECDRDSWRDWGEGGCSIRGVGMWSVLSGHTHEERAAMNHYAGLDLSLEGDRDLLSDTGEMRNRTPCSSYVNTGTASSSCCQTAVTAS
jgi:GNAT superfamily N-acetyltransferase